MQLTDQRAIDYMRKELQRGVQEDALVKAMSNAGYDEQSIRDTLPIVRGQPAPQQQQRQLPSDFEAPGPMPDGYLSRSFYLTKLCVRIIKKDTELLWYTILSGVLNTFFIGIMIIPFFLPLLIEEVAGEALAVTTMFFIIFLTYLGTALITTFFNVAIVYVVKNRIEGGNPTFSDGVSFGFKKFGRIFSWALVSAIIGLLLRIIERLAQRIPIIGQIIVSILIAIFGMVWSIISIFVIPSMVLYDIGPFASIKKSVEVLKKTWGENILFAMGMGFVFFLFILLGFGVGIIGLVAYGSTQSYVVLVGAIVLALLIWVGSFIFFRTASMVFNTAVFLYGANGTIAPQFGEGVLKNAFKQKKKSMFGKAYSK